MGYNKEFEDIRPYNDSEVKQVIARLVKDPGLYEVLKFVHPQWGDDDVRNAVSEVETIADFQKKVAHPGMRILIDRTVDNLSFSGLENIKKDESYLFISNHRDIILDSAILNIVLFESDHGTIQTAIGSNLLSSAIVTDLTKLNKNFVVKRNTGAREFYENSMLLSAYIRHTIDEAKHSIWIAQREGRTKDGLDKTQPGLLKMLTISCEKAMRECFRELRVTPVAISYEHDPCDVLKIPELKAISRDEKYEKQPLEDFNSIITGLTGQKGRVHISIGKTIDKELDILAEFPNINDKLRMLGEFIDSQIYQNYKLWPTNYMAFDILEGTVLDKPEYEGADPEAFNNEVKERLSAAGLHSDEDYERLLGMYANPVRNHLTVSES
ncbi:hypothetical protein G3O08_19580 [Cryomorpha ignava]|uniref:Phospholipid/glycerol acyltransferase domain-containing protein n=1 Tax=Cryomorpha ignava TaxID=101383 RepID=A0A7K3WYF5_9FLAO|nr:1-acyl-sn-glycerol-3-phosphate acyltransferase [Cryomorpha ignava]NEN25695.1 hypothetical protein [Cryomorpha ignava]